MCTPDLLGTQGTHSRFTASDGALAGPEGTHVPFRVHDGRIEIQGDQRERLVAVLEGMGYRVKRVGG